MGCWTDKSALATNSISLARVLFNAFSKLRPLEGRFSANLDSSGRNHPHHESFAGQGSDGKVRRMTTPTQSSIPAFPHLFLSSPWTPKLHRNIVYSGLPSILTVFTAYRGRCGQRKLALQTANPSVT